MTQRLTQRISLLTRLSFGLCLGGALLAPLSGCVPLVLGGAVAGTALVASDRRTSGTQLEDEGIELRAANRIRTALGERGHINVYSYGRQVLLVGEVANEQDKAQVEQIAARVENVTSVVNELAVMGNSTLTQRSSDVLVSGRVRAVLIDTPDLFASAFKIVTERGTVYLMGRVTQREADRATAVVRTTTGVQKVVRIFEIISEAELARLLPPPTKPTPIGADAQRNN
jgi:osmotically-inducible protein OsmY